MSDRNRLMTLLIHRRTREKYYRDHDKFVDKQKKWLESIRHEPFEALPKDRQIYYLDRWFWPPWRFNDIVGFAEIEMETPWTVIGHLYLPEGRVTSATKKPLFLNYACTSADFEPGNIQPEHDTSFQRFSPEIFFQVNKNQASPIMNAEPMDLLKEL